MREPDCVGAFVRDEQHRVYTHRRSPERRLFPGSWDVVGGHLDPGETPEQALARELEEETGWTLRYIEAVIADWEWEHDGRVRRELDYLIDVEGDLAAPRLEEGKHDASAWVGPDDLELMLVGRTDGDRRLRDLVAKAVRIRLTERLRLEPVGPDHADDLWTMHQDDAVAEWHAGRWSREDSRRNAASMGQGWEANGVGTWIAYDRTSGALVGRGGLSRMGADADVTGAVAAALGSASGPWLDDRLELGWTIRAAHWGHGYATEAGRAGLAYAFDELGAGEVVAFTERHNTQSRAVMERLGMREVGEFAGEGLVEGRTGVHEGAPFAFYALRRP